MSFIYQPKGKAGEYCQNALNIYIGCNHRCFYCYGPACMKMTPEQFSIPRRRNGLLPGITKEAWQYRGQEVLLEFVGDPYASIDDKCRDTRAVLEIFMGMGIKTVILTKAGKRSTRDFDILSKNPDIVRYGTTLTFDNVSDSLKNEPGAAIPNERIEALREAKDRGFKTWVSIEPVIIPEQSLAMIEKSSPFVDEFKIGKWNHHPDAKKIDWHAFLIDATVMLKGMKKTFYVKKDLYQYR